MRAGANRNTGSTDCRAQADGRAETDRRTQANYRSTRADTDVHPRGA